MAENEQLTAFLAEGAAAATPEPQQAPPAEPTPPPAPSPQSEPKPAEKPPEAEDDGEPPPPLEGQQGVARRAYEDERRKRQNWVERASRAEAERDELRKQLEAAQRPAQPPPPQQQYIPPPDPATDPHGFAQFLVQRQQESLLNERLNMSELALRDKLGDEKVNAYVAEFKEAARADPSLWNKLHAQVHPYGWLTREVEKQRLHRDVGDDPAAFRARIEAEARAKWEAEAKTAPPISPAAGLQPSLATARSVAGRSAPTWSGEPSLEDVLAPIQNRKSQNGQTRRF